MRCNRLTVKSDLQKAVASAQAAKGTYLMAAQSTEDQSAKQQFEEMSTDIDNHINYLNSRLDYLGGITQDI